MVRFRAHPNGTSEEEGDDDKDELEALALISEDDSTSSRPCRRVMGHVVDGGSLHESELTDNNYVNHNTFIGHNGNMNGIYPYSPSNFNGNVQGTPTGKKGLSFKFTTAVVVLACALSRYGPEAPPLNSFGVSQSWAEFISTEGGTMAWSLWKIGVALNYALWCCVIGFKEDIQQFPNVMIQFLNYWSEKSRQVCPLESSFYPLGSLEKQLATRIVGQQRAVQIVASTIDAWDDMHDSSIRQQRPLFLVFSGPVGVGKLELSRHLAGLLFQNCSQTNVTTGEDAGIAGYPDQGLLLLQGGDFKLSETTTKSAIAYSLQDTNSNLDSSNAAEEKLHHYIGCHVERQKGQGAVVVIHHVEQMPPAVFQRLCRQLSAPEATLSYTKDVRQEGWPPQETLTVSLNKVIFVFTTNIGAKTLFRTMKKFGGSIENVAQLDLKLSMEHELDVHFGNGNGDFGRIFHAIAPFVPLGSAELQQILKNRIEEISLKRSGVQWKRLLITEAAQNFVCNEEHMEYLTLQRRLGDAAAAALVFATTGAKELETGKYVMNRIISQANRCLSVRQPDRLAVLDFDGLQALFCWCENENAAHCGDASCHEACRFSFDY